MIKLRGMQDLLFTILSFFGLTTFRNMGWMGIVAIIIIVAFLALTVFFAVKIIREKRADKKAETTLIDKEIEEAELKEKQKNKDDKRLL